MKKAAADLRIVKKEINALTKKLEQLSKKTDKLIQSQTAAKSKPKAKSKAAPKTKAASKAKAVPEAKAAAAPKTARKSAAAKKSTPTDQVLKIVKRYKKGISVTKLKKLSGFNDKQISNIVHRANKKGVLERVERGVYKLA